MNGEERSRQKRRKNQQQKQKNNIRGKRLKEKHIRNDTAEKERIENRNR